MSVQSNSASSTAARTRSMVLTALMAAVICVVGPFSIPIPVSPVPISLVNLAIYFSCYILGMKRGALSVLLYLLIGFAGLPVFAGFTGGPGKLLGPTGGYLVGYLFIAFICGFAFDRRKGRAVDFIGMLLGTAACYFFGTAWLAYQGGMSFYAALAAGVIPFIPGDLVKIAIAFFAAPLLRKRLEAASLV